MRKRLTVGILIGIAVIVLIYCIACNIINNLNSMPTAVKIIFGLSDFANTAIGALFGFGASLLLENYLIDYNKEKAIDNIVAEMTQMCLYIAKIYSENVRKKNSIGLELSEDIRTVLCKFNNKFDGNAENSKYSKDRDTKGLGIIKRRVTHCRYNIYLPIWDSVLQNGDLLRFKDKEYFECLINIYTRLNKFKSQIDSFDDSIEDEELFLFLFELYNDVKNLSSFLSANKIYVVLLCQYLKGDANTKLKEEFLSEFNLH